MERDAILSDCGRYRYTLTRRWADGPTCGFIMLNPSTADADVDDPTIRRCIGFAKREGCGGLLVVNIFAYRATKPEDMELSEDPVGERNDDAFREAARVDGPLIAAWGSHWMAVEPGRSLRGRFIRQLSCLGTTKDGHPRHPLYVRADAPLVPL